MDPFGELRSKCHEPASVEAFAELMRFLERLCEDQPAKSRDEYLPYVMGVLEHWPDETRLVPRRLKYAFLGNQSEVKAEMVALGRAFAIKHFKLTIPQLERLLASKALPSLTQLELSFCELRDRHIELLAGAETNLTTLDLGSNKLGPEGIQHLLSSNLREQLVTLRLWQNSLYDDGIEPLTTSTWPKLEHLDLLSTDCADRGADALSANLDRFPSLETLTISYNNLSLAAVDRLRAAAAVRGLEAEI
mgnify:FL=1